ncbi:MAG: alpha/beta hydrolase [Robiginitomaculum sp.]
MMQFLKNINHWFWQQKRGFKLLLTFVFIPAGAWFFLRTPDTDFYAMHKKYGGSKAQYTNGKPNAPYSKALHVHYRDEGNLAGAPIVFIHGSSASLHTWEGVVSALGDKYRLISYDQPGHGLTGPHPQDNYKASGMFEALDAVITELGIEKVVLVGNSMGGWVSWRYALKYPQRVKALVLIDAAGAPSDKAPPLNLGFRLVQNPITRPLTKFITPRPLIKKSLEQTVGDPSKINEKTVNLYWELLRYPGNRRATTLRTIAPRGIKYGSRLNEITVPTLILWGKKDQLIHASDAELFESAIPNSQKIIYPNIGHIPMEEIPEQVAKDIDEFLRGIER